MNAIEISDLRKTYGDFSIQGISLCLPAGCIMGLAGENGAGKSTTIKLIMNAVKKDAGEIVVLGKNNESEDFCQIKQDIGVVLDEAYYPEVLTAKNLGAILKRTYGKWDSGKYDELLRHFSIPAAKPFRDFSRGMKMKLAIAAALSHDPKLLILDEATSGLDPVIRDEILDIFNDFTRQSDHSILLSSHIISDLEKICDYIAFMHKGSLLLCGEKDAIIERYAIVHLPKDGLEALPEDCVAGVRHGEYGVDVLVERAAVSDYFRPEHASLEDIILFMSRKER